MKQLACSQIGGPATCNFMVPGNNADEIAKNGMAHVEQAHPEMAAQIKAMSKEDMQKWMDDTNAKLATQPEM